MPVKLRLKRQGRKKAAHYAIVAADARAPRDGRFIQKIGHYNPVKEPARVYIDHDAAINWLSNGAQPTLTVKHLLRHAGVTLKYALIKQGKDEETVERIYSAWLDEKRAATKKKFIMVNVEGKALESIPEVAKPAPKAAPVVEEAPAEEPVAEEAAPVVEEAPAEEPVAEEAAPVVEEAPAEEPVAEEAAPAVEEAPAEEPVAEEAAPVVEEAPAEEPVAEEAAPVVEEAPAEEAAPVVEEAPAKEEAAPAKPDDLRKIEGIGPKIAGLLNEGGINTFAELAAAEQDRLKEILAAAGARYAAHNPSTWPKQSGLAAEGKWDELKTLQDYLDGGREPETTA